MKILSGHVRNVQTEWDWKFHCFLKNFFNWNFLDQQLLPYKFHGSDMCGMYFFIFASCEPLTTSTQCRAWDCHIIEFISMYVELWNSDLCDRLKNTLFLASFYTGMVSWLEMEGPKLHISSFSFFFLFCFVFLFFFFFVVNLHPNPHLNSLEFLHLCLFLLYFCHLLFHFCFLSCTHLHYDE